MNKVFLIKTQKLIWISIIVSIIALVFMPLLPWFSITVSEYSGSVYFNEGMLNMESKILSYYSYDDTSETIKAELYKLNESLGLISLSFWLAIIFGIMSLIGITVYKIERIPIISYIILLIGCLMMIFGILVIIGHWNFIAQVYDFPPPSSSGHVFFGYNYVPLIMGVILLIDSVSYTLTVAPISTRGLILSLRQKQAEAEARYREYNAGIKQPTKAYNHHVDKPKSASVEKTSAGSTPKFCPNCGTKLEGNPKFCPSCGKKLL